jgi:hypothetical protein
MKKISYLFLFTLLLSSAIVSGQNRHTRRVENFTKVTFRYPGKLYIKQGSPQKVEVEGSKDALEEVEFDVDGSRLTIGKENSWFNWNDWNDNDRITVYITVPEIEGLSVSGSGDIIGQSKITTDDLDLNVSGSGTLQLEMNASGNVEADVSGSGEIDLRGRCRGFDSDVSGSGKVMLAVDISGEADFSVSGSGRIGASGSAKSVQTNISGSGKVLAADLVTERCLVRISGSGDVEINVKNELDANISGSGSVAYKGNPSKVNSHASGSGKVRKL